MRGLLRDLYLELRALVRRPAYALAAIVTLALAIGLNGTMFSLLHAGMLEPFPVEGGDRLAYLWQSLESAGVQTTAKVERFLAWRDQDQVFDAVEGYRIETLQVEGLPPWTIEAAHVTPGLLPLLGASPATGRLFSQADVDDGVGAAVISHRLWRQRFGGDPGVLGTSLMIGGRSCVVVGVAARGFDYPFGKTEIWLPLEISGSEPVHGLFALARLAPGVSPPQARAALIAVDKGLAEGQAAGLDWRSSLSMPQEMLGAPVRRALIAFQAGVGLVLLIACANVANLLLARATGRGWDMAVRRALGAGPVTLLRQALAESLLLAAAGGVLGALLALWGCELLVAFLPEHTLTFARSRLAPSGTLLLVSAVLAPLAASLAALAPAIKAWRTDPARALATARGGDAERGRSRLSGALVVVETGLALMLLVGAGLLVNSFVRQLAVDPGFDPDGLVALRLELPETRYPNQVDSRAFVETLQDRLGATRLPDMEAVSLVTSLPSRGGIMFGEIEIEGREPSPEGASFKAGFMSGTPGYLSTFGFRLVAGRGFTEADVGPGEHASEPVVINRRMAESSWTGPAESGDAVGKRFRLDSDGDWYQVIGVVEDGRLLGLGSSLDSAQLFFPLASGPIAEVAVVARGERPERLVAPLTGLIQAIDPQLPVMEVVPMRRLLWDSLEREKFRSAVMMLLAAAALLLAAIGLYGLLADAVGRQRREIGIRLALGGRVPDVVRLVVRRGMRLVAAGLLLGIAGSLALGHLLSGLLYQVAPRDPLTLGIAAALLALVGLAATLGPARRAARLDPMVVLREE